MQRSVNARSYNEVANWREYEKELPATFKLSKICPEEEWFNWRDIAVHVDRLAAPEAPLKLVLVHGIGGYVRTPCRKSVRGKPRFSEKMA